jgi:hypothetical protein
LKTFVLFLFSFLSINWISAQQANATINGTPGPFIFNGTGVTQNGQTFTFSSTGGGDAITSPNGTLLVGGNAGATTLDFNLAHANTWTAQQTFSVALALTSLESEPCIGTNSSGVVIAGTCSSGSSAFSALTSGTNTTAAMLVGTGGSLGVTGTGTIAATSSPLSGLTGLGTGVGTFLAVPTSANLAAALTDETGTGADVFANGPTLVAPNLGTPASGIITNLTGTCTNCVSNAAVGISTSGTANQVWGMNSGATAQGWQTVSGSGITLQTNSAANSSQILFNAETSTTNSVGLTITPSNPSGGIEKWEITGSSYTGNAATSSAVLTAATTTNASFSVLVAASTSGNQSPQTVSGFTINPSTGAVALPGAATFSGATHGITIAAGSGVQPTGVAGSVIYSTDTAGTGNALVDENNGGYSRICTAANASTNTGCQGTGAVSSVSGTGVISNSSSTGAVTIAWTGTSGGIPYFSSSTTTASSAALTANVLVKGGGAGSAPTNSLATDSGTALAYTGTGGITSPVFTANGTTAGFIDFPQGTTSAAVAPCNTANSLCFQAPTSVTSQLRVWASAPASGFSLWTNASGTMTETIQGTQGSLTSGTGLLGTLAINSVLASTVASYAGHFTNLQVVTSLGGTCTTLPQFNVFDGTTNVGSTVTASATTQTKGTGTSTAQTLTFAAGDVIGVYISTAGGTCVANNFIVTAQYSTP